VHRLNHRQMMNCNQQEELLLQVRRELFSKYFLSLIVTKLFNFATRA